MFACTQNFICIMYAGNSANTGSCYARLTEQYEPMDTSDELLLLDCYLLQSDFCQHFSGLPEAFVWRGILPP